jgi:tetratricopeptide (TPR) repeat protein
MSSDSINSLLDGHADSLYDAGKFDEAMRVAGTALRNARQAAEDDEAELPLLVNALEKLAGLHQEVGDFDKAESMYLEALEIAERCGFPKDRFARMRSSLAMLYDFNQREEQAIPHYEQAISEYEKLSPPRGQDAAQLRNNLAMIYKSLGRFALAEQHYLMALETLEEIYGRNNERVAAVFNNLGGLYYAAGFPEQSKEMHLEALDIRTQVFGPNHPEVAQSYNNLATSCYELQDDAGAQQNYEKSLSILEQHIEATGPDAYAETGADYLTVLEAAGEDKKAAAFRKRMEKMIARA